MRMITRLFLATFGMFLLMSSALPIVGAQETPAPVSTDSSQNILDERACDTRARPSPYFLGVFPAWYRGLPESNEQEDLLALDCANPAFVIGFNIFDLLLRLAGVLAVVYVVVGGFKYTLSDGNPEKATEARKSIINGLVGAVIAIMASCIVTYVVGRLGAGGAGPFPEVDGDLALQNALNTAFIILGGISLIMVTIQGMRFTLSSGDPGKASQARNGIIYALVGVVVAVSGSSIVTFALNRAVPPDGDPVGLFGRVAALIAIITGVISVFMVIIGGMRFILSRGDAAKAASARNTIIYALVGTVVAAFAAPLISLQPS